MLKDFCTKIFGDLACPIGAPRINDNDFIRKPDQRIQTTFEVLFLVLSDQANGKAFFMGGRAITFSQK